MYRVRPAPRSGQTPTSVREARATPQAATDETTWIAFRLIDQRGQPIGNEPFTIDMPDGESRDGITDPNGFAEFRNLKTSGSCALGFPALHPIRQTESIATGALHELRRNLPTCTAKWSRERVMPFHWEPERVAEPAEHGRVRMLVDVEHVPDGTAAKIRISSPEYDRSVQIDIEDLEVRQGKIIDPATGECPEHLFTFNDGIYEPWDRYLYRFWVSVSYRRLKGESPVNEPLTLLRRFVLVRDAHDVSEKKARQGQAAMQAICADAQKEIEAAGLPALEAESYAMTDEVIQNALGAAAALGNTMFGSYAWFISAHGGFDPDTRQGRISLGERAKYQDFERLDFDGPKYLAIIAACEVALDPRLPSVFLARGTQHVVGFRGVVSTEKVKAFSSLFLREWVGKNLANPEKIPECFVKAAQRIAYQPPEEPGIRDDGTIVFPEPPDSKRSYPSPRLYGRGSSAVPRSLQRSSDRECEADAVQYEMEPAICEDSKGPW